MSVKTRLQRTATCGGIPLLFVRAAASHVEGTTGEAAAGPARTAHVSEVAVDSCDQLWQELMAWLLQALLSRLNCGSPTVPESVPVAMMLVVDCYASGGLALMSQEETAAFVQTIDEASAAMKNAPSSIPLQTQIQFLATLKLMRAEATLR